MNIECDRAIVVKLVFSKDNIQVKLRSADFKWSHLFRSENQPTDECLHRTFADTSINIQNKNKPNAR